MRATSPRRMTTPTDTQAMFRGSSRNVTCLSVVVVGAAVVDSGMTIVTVAASDKKHVMYVSSLNLTIEL